MREQHRGSVPSAPTVRAPGPPTTCLSTPRPRRGLNALALLALAVAGCAGKPPHKPAAPGSTDWVSATTGPAVLPNAPGSNRQVQPSVRSKPRERWAPFGALASFRRTVVSGRSQHFAGAHDAEVLANGNAVMYPALGPSRTLPPGAVLIELDRPRGNDPVIAHLAMTKRAPGFDPTGGDWEYLVLDPTGNIEQRGILAACARCHAEAPHDHVFGGTGRSDP